MVEVGIDIRRPGTTASRHVHYIHHDETSIVLLLAYESKAGPPFWSLVGAVNAPLDRHSGGCIDKVGLSGCGLVDILDKT